ncbi:sigma-70 family RNA polymerase sigma factor [Planosporangium thailandense]|uniref:Sigma-70 family RNA polymerase sigma factor n=1 Tax=Planosporangium thailandense TaxID=765197 RepID=A0ABX0Y6S7_9ACTN|nr:sigma-70 family RNA polymerase sigma factor [Planosporangium thailandense]NJC73837.1 sigma-70 family RNA polymerase sigma factor [Planosporangium thailandense]
MRETADFDAFYASTSRRVLGQVFMMTGGRAEAEDAVAEAYARAWQQWDKVSTHAAPEAWVRTTAYRISVSTWRKATNRLLAHRRHGQTDDVPGLTPDHVALVDALRDIAAEQRRVIVLHYYVGMSLDEISRETNCPVNTVKTRLARARKALATKVSEFADDSTSTSGLGARSNA